MGDAPERNSSDNEADQVSDEGSNAPATPISSQESSDHSQNTEDTSVSQSGLLVSAEVYQQHFGQERSSMNPLPIEHSGSSARSTQDFSRSPTTPTSPGHEISSTSPESPERRAHSANPSSVSPTSPVSRVRSKSFTSLIAVHSKSLKSQLSPKQQESSMTPSLGFSRPSTSRSNPILPRSPDSPIYSRREISSMSPSPIPSETSTSPSNPVYRKSPDSHTPIREMSSMSSSPVPSGSSISPTNPISPRYSGSPTTSRRDISSMSPSPVHSVSSRSPPSRVHSTSPIIPVHSTSPRSVASSEIQVPSTSATVLVPSEAIRNPSNPEVEGAAVISTQPHSLGLPADPQFPGTSQTPEISELCRRVSRQILELLECPVCYEAMVPPVVLCFCGHDICPACRLKMDKCPICRGPITVTRNLFTEAVTMMIQKSCEFCALILPHYEMYAHSCDCMKRTVECKAGVGVGEVVKCGWTGYKEQLKGHVFEVHGLDFVHEGRGPRKLLATAPNIDEVFLVCLKEKYFWVVSRIVHGYRQEYSQYIGPAEEAMFLKYTFSFHSPHLDRPLTYSHTARTLEDDPSQTFTFMLGLYVREALFQKQYVDGNGCIYEYRFFVSRIE
ncbi:mucin-1-like [Periplaneta americana]|uniref:mucin-1-like n=1 Tax=Periplaneta americana TaxID=6978 RepID=UPI0037E7E306